MTELEITAGSGAELPAITPEDMGRVARLTIAWLGRRSENTQREYRKDLLHWLAWCERTGILALRARMADMDGWIAWQRENGIRGDGHPAAEASISRRVASVSSWYKYLYRNTKDDAEPLALTNPADTDGRPVIDPDDSTTSALSTAEADRLITAADADSIRSSAIIRSLLYLGLRCGSLINANVEDLGRHLGHRALLIKMKGRKKRFAPLPPALAEVIDAMLAERGNPTTGPLFITRNGRPISEPWMFLLVRRLAKAARIDTAASLSPHSLRHTFATDALNAGTSLRDLQDAMGHKDPRTTRRYDRDRDAIDRHPAHILATRFGARRGTANSEES